MENYSERDKEIDEMALEVLQIYIDDIDLSMLGPEAREVFTCWNLYHTCYLRDMTRKMNDLNGNVAKLERDHDFWREEAKKWKEKHRAMTSLRMEAIEDDVDRAAAEMRADEEGGTNA